MTDKEKREDAIIKLSILVFLGLFFWGFIHYQTVYVPDQVRQEIGIATPEQLEGRAMTWEIDKSNELDSLGIKFRYDSIEKLNPYRAGKIIYVLETKWNNTSSYDYGTEEEIALLKCAKFKAMENHKQAMIKAKEREERARFVIDSVGQSGLDRLNYKSCK